MQHPVDLWTVSLATPSVTYLSEDETARANRFKFEKDRVAWTRARSALRSILAGYMGADPRELGFVYGAHGKPALHGGGDLEFNLSHAGDWALIAVSRSVAVGVDIERMRPHFDMAPLLERLGETDLPDTPQELYQRWTQREAKSKAAGGALFDTPLETIRVLDLNAPEGYAAAVALVGHEPAVGYCVAGGSL